MKNILGIILYISSYWFANSQIVSLPDHKVIVDVKFDVNRIYEFNTIHETYSVDGYLTLSWQDDRLINSLDSVSYIQYDEEVIPEILSKEVWSPDFEFINVMGIRDITNQLLTIHNDGQVEYLERFNGQFSTEMDFKQYPFDTQTFPIIIESFYYDTTEVVFQTSDYGVHLDDQFQKHTIDWDLIDLGSSETVYNWNWDDNKKSDLFSRWQMDITLKRNPGYFYWQFFFPLGLIIVATWITFWIPDFGNRLNTSFTLLLTVVAFNFYTSTLLPRLPYNTFIEVSIMSGYIMIFICIVFNILHKLLIKKNRFKAANLLLKNLRWALPTGYIITLGWIISDFL